MQLGAEARVALLAALIAFTPATELSAQLPQLTGKAVAFRNGEVELRGTLLIPPAKTPVPAVVFLHGSGPQTRDGARRYAETFADVGVASLFFDKRGSGESAGSWLTSSLDDLAADALAAVDFLRSVKEIDAKRIGLWGVSQAGWVAPLAAAKSDDVAFMILISGGGASPRESEMFSYSIEFERAGLSAEERTRATEILGQYFDYLATGEGRAKLLADLQGIRSSSLSPLADQLDRILPSDENRPNWSWVASHDPAQNIAALDIPILLLFGDRDHDHPTELAVRRWREALRVAVNPSAAIVVFPGAGHGIRMREGYSGQGRAPFADGYMEVQIGWLWLNVVSGHRDVPPNPSLQRTPPG